MPWFDTQREESRLSAEIATTHARGGPRWVAFIAGDIEHGLARFALPRWRERLPGFQVHCIPTASWLRPKFIEHLLKAGGAGVLIIRDARTESAARDGHRWVSARLLGERKPVFRPDRAGGSTSWCVLDYDPARPAELVRLAQAFRRHETPSHAQPERRGKIASLAAGAVLALALGLATIAPSHLRVDHPASATPEFVFSFKALGDREAGIAADATAEAAKPVHMRGRPTAKPQRAPVRVRLTIDGLTRERTFRAKGISRDGPALDEWRELLSAGEHDVVIEVLSGPTASPRTWSGKVRTKPHRVHVITFEPDAGFRIE